MPRITLPIANGFYVSDSLSISNQECVMWSPNAVQVQGALSPDTLVGTAGITQKSTTGQVNQSNRGLHVKAGLAYFLNGDTLIRLDQSIDITGIVTFSNTVIGVIPGTELVSMADNGTQLMVLVPGGSGFIINEAADPVFEEITDLDFVANGIPQYVVFKDGFFIVTTDTKKFIKSAANNGLDWNALDSGTAEADPDTIVAPIVHRNRLYIAGSETIQDFVNSPNPADLAAFPFVAGGLVIPKGVFAPLSLIDTGDTFLFVGGGVNESPAVWALAGNSVQKISTTAIDVVLERLTESEVSNISSYNYGINGALFICFKLPKTTFCYNTITGKWNEEKSIITNSLGVDEVVGRRVSGVVTAYGLTLCGDDVDGRIGSIEADTYTDYGNEIHRSFSTQPFSDAGNVMTVSSLELTVNSGGGDFDTLNPKINMSKSLDNVTFDDPISREIGKQGEYDQRLIWNRLGRVPRFTSFNFTMTDPVDPTIIKLEANIRSHQIGS